MLHCEISDKAFEKLQKLIRHEQSAREIGSLAEADAFATRIQTMLDEYHIALADVPLEDQPVDPVIHSDGVEANDGLPHLPHRVAWLEKLAGGIAQGNYCRFVMTSHSSKISFAGHRSDVSVCEYMFNTLARNALRLEHEKAEAARRDGTYSRAFKNQFLYGYATSINYRLWKKRREQDAIHTSAVVALVHNRDSKVDEFCKAEFDGRFRRLDWTPNDLRAYYDGQNAGSAASIPSGAINARRTKGELNGL
jgi:hypothetical protein